MVRNNVRLYSLVASCFHIGGITVCAFGGRWSPRHSISHRSRVRSRQDALPDEDIPTLSSQHPPFRLKNIDHVVIRCRNFPAMFDFYHRILGCTIDEPIDEHVNRFGGALTHLRAGSCYIDLLAYDTNHVTKEGQDALARMHAGGAGLDDSISIDDMNISSDASTLDHLCLRIDPFDKQQLLTYLKEENIDIVTVGDTRLGADGVGPSIYVYDPECNVIELKGSPYQDYNAQNAKSNVNQSDDKASQMKNPNDKDTLEKGKGNDDCSNEISSEDSNTQHNSLEQKSTIENVVSNTIPLTPCNRICRYNTSFYDGKVCIGCFREAYEIEMWQAQTSIQKAMTLLDAIDRCSENGIVEEKFDGAITVEELTRQYDHWFNMAKME